MNRKLNSDPELLMVDEMNLINRKDIRVLTEKLPLELGFEIQWYYYENRNWSAQQLLEETDSQIKEFEELYGSDFETEFGKLSSVEADGRNDAGNYYDWVDVIERRKSLTEQIEKEK